MHRSEDGGGWLNLGASLSESYSDSTVSAGSSYSYSVVSVSAADSGVQGAAVTLNDVVVPGVAGDITLSAAGRKVRGTKLVTLSWGHVGNVQITRNGSDIGTGDSNTYEDALGKGGGSYIYQVCEMADATNCSNTATVVF